MSGSRSAPRKARCSVGLLAAFCFSAFTCARGQILTAQQPRTVKQDSQGQLWSISGRLEVLEDEWKLRPVLFPPDERRLSLAASNPWLLLPLLFEEGKPFSLSPMRDGSMACVWRLSGERMAVTGHRDQELTFHGISVGKIPDGGLRVPPFADSQNRLWVTGDSTEIRRTDALGNLSVVYLIPPGELLPDGRGRVCHQFVTEDGNGRQWVWSNLRAGGMSGAVLNGVLLFEGDKVHLHRRFDGIQTRRFSFVGPQDEKHMWVATVGEGIYSVNIDTWEATRLVEPEPGSFHWVQKIFVSGEDLFVIAGRREQFAEGALWRRRGEKWTRLIEKLSYAGIFTDIQREWLRVGSDVVLSAFHAEPWIIRHEGDVERLDWQRGFGLQDARALFQLSDGTFLANGMRGETFRGKMNLTSTVPSPRVHEIYYANNVWTTDAAGRVWAVFPESPTFLNEWDGRKWTQRPIPEDLRFQGTAVDQLGRIWFPREKQTAFYDPASGAWSVFPSFEAALIEQKSDAPSFDGSLMRFHAPEYSSDRRRIAYRDGSYRLRYFDGSTWQTLWRGDIDASTDRNYFTMGMPFFDRSDRLCVCIGKQIWILGEDNRWQQGVTDVKYSDDSNGQVRRPEIRVPAECPVPSADSTALDNNGATWITAQGKLYKWAFGKLVEIFSEGEPNPFIYGRTLLGAWVDPSGTAFLKTAVNKQIMILPRSPLLPVSMVIEKPAPDSVVARFTPEPTAKLSYQWKLDGGPWKMASDAVLTFDFLLAGPHTLTAVAINDELQATAPKVVEFSIDIDPQEQLELFISRLADRDYTKREAAVAALSQQPDLALPALRNARLQASLDHRWWIDVAIQESERNAKAGER